MSAIDQSSLIEEINEIMASGPKNVNALYTCMIKTAAGRVVPLSILSIDIKRDYAGGYCDEIQLTVAMGIGDYEHAIAPYADDLTITINKTPLKENSQTTDASIGIEAQSMRATLYKRTSQAITNSTTYGSDKDAGNVTGIREVTFQLIDLALEQTRMQGYGTNFLNATAMDAITTAMMTIAKGLKVDKAHQIKGFEFYPPNNNSPLGTIVVPHGTRAVDVPGYIAHHYGSPYSAGFGYFLQGGYWYLYPLYDLTRYGKSKKTLTVISVPANRFPHVERTYRKTSAQTIILSTAASNFNDPSDALQLATGNGTRYLSADQVFDGFAQVQNNVATAYREKNANEYIAQARKNGLNNVTLAQDSITNNSFRQMGLMAARMGSFLQVPWENSDPSAIYPGMPVNYLYAIKGKIYSLKGIVQAVHHRTERVQPGLTPTNYTTTSALTLFLEKSFDWARNVSDTDSTSTTTSNPTNNIISS